MIWCWPETHDDQVYWIHTVELLWLFDFFLSFLRAGPLNKSVYDTSGQYLKGKFVFDAIALLPGIFTAQSKSLCLLKVARFVHFDRYMVPLDYLAKICSKGYENGKQQYLLWYLMACILATHIMSCLWLELGLRKNYTTNKRFHDDKTVEHIFWITNNSDFEGYTGY
jgi:hypothetical protein